MIWLKVWLRKTWVQNLIWLLLIVVVYMSVRTWQNQLSPKGEAPAISSTLTVSGKPIDLASFRGKPLMLYFWATWCNICKLEQGSIRSVTRDHQVLSVAWKSGSAAQVGAYMKKHDLNMPTIIDDSGEIAKLYGVRGTPKAYFIDEKGVIRSIDGGYSSEIGMRIRLWFAGI